MRCFTYAELFEDMDGCLKEAVKLENKNSSTKVTVEQTEELKGYMREFMEDVESNKECLTAEKIRDCPQEELPLLLPDINTDQLRKRLKDEKLPG